MVDTSCDLPAEYLVEHGIEVLSMPFEIDGQPHDQGYWQEISDKEYYDGLRQGRVARTSQINPESFVSVFTDYAKQDKALVIILLSSGLSSTLQNAKVALLEVKKSYPQCNIFVIDSISATTGSGLLAVLAVRKRAEGLSAGETAEWLETKKHSCFALFTVDDLMYLHRGGRLSKLSAIAGTVLNIKPLLNIAPDGTLRQKEKVRGTKAALKMLAEQMKRSLAPGARLNTVLISHTDCPDVAAQLADLIKAEFPVECLIVMMTGPIIGAHLGPGAVTLMYEGDMTREEYEKTFYA